MTALRSLVGRSTLQAALAITIVSTGAALAWRGDIDGPSWLGVVIVVASYFFRQPQPTKPE